MTKYLVAHLLSGQAVIGWVTSPSDPVTTNSLLESHILQDPFELMVHPGSETNRSQVAMIPYGSLMGVCPEHEVKTMYLNHSKVYAFSTPSAAFAENYQRFLDSRKGQKDSQCSPST